MSKLWSKEGQEQDKDISKKVEAFTVGNDYLLDQVLVPYDLKASKVHAAALRDAGILSAEEAEDIITELDHIYERWQVGDFEIKQSHEDAHTAIEEWLTYKLGDTGKKIHTGRSRNDQVLTAVRLYEIDKLKKVSGTVKNLANELLQFTEEYESVPMPGFTHTRKAMLSGAGQWAAGFLELLLIQHQQADRITGMISRSPLGTAAGFGSTIRIDRDAEAEQLGFETVLISATSAQLSRGWMELQLVQYLSAFTAILNRFASDVILYSSEAYGFLELGEAVCTGSSIMPQKRNPDVAELIRANHSRMDGYVASLQSLTANLGSGYHRDLQLTKEPVIHAFECVMDVLEAAILLVQNMSVDSEVAQKACTSELFAAEEANRLVVEEGYSFRDAYKKVAKEPGQAGEADPKSWMKKFTQLGSPGNAGLDHLKKMLEDC